MRTTALAAAALLGTATLLSAQAPRTAIEIRPFAGVNIPTGTQRDLFKDAFLVGISPAYQLSPKFHVVASVAWMPEKTRYQVSDRDVSLFQYDVGVEFSLERAIGGNWFFRPFAGVGGGGRTYAYQSNTLADRTCVAAYGSLGSELRTGPLALRLEARDNVFCYKSPMSGGDSDTRNDVSLALGMAYHVW